MSELGEKRAAQPTKPTHFSGIDGLRALAIIGVIAFHARPSLLQGGFIGVTMFFVITGFLATRSVLTALDRTGTFDYKRYLVRRIIRLWPPVLATIAITPGLVWLFAPSLLQKVASDALPSSVFVSNWVYIFRQVPYFQAAGLPSPLTHLWFLGVTMQFYLIWPLLMLGLGKLTESRWQRAVVVTLVMIASTAAMFLLFDPSSTSRVYYGTDTRLAELAAGALLAIWITPSRRTVDNATQTIDGFSAVPLPSRPTMRAHATFANALGAVALIVLLAGFWFANGYLPTMYQGGYFVAAIVSLTALACVVDNDSIWPRVLGCRPLRYLGSRSFSLYLMHYPLLQLMNPATRTIPLPWWGWVLEAIVILAVGEVFYQLVEATRNKLVTSRETDVRSVASSAAVVVDGAGAAAADAGTAGAETAVTNTAATVPGTTSSALSVPSQASVQAPVPLPAAVARPQRNLHVVEHFEEARQSASLEDAFESFESTDDQDDDSFRFRTRGPVRMPQQAQPQSQPQVRPQPVPDAVTGNASGTVDVVEKRTRGGALVHMLRRSRLRPGAWVMSALGVVTVIALTWAQVNWAQIGQARAVELRPELAQEPGKPLKPKPKPKPTASTSSSASAAASATPTIKPKAEKVPNNFDISKYHYDPATQSCSADIMMVGDSVTSGTSEFIQQTFPNGFIDGKPNRQMPEAVGIYQADVAAGHSGSVVIFGLGTNGIIQNEQEVQQLIDAAGGKPVYFVTIRMPYPWQENNNNTMLREAAKKNPNVGIIDWHGYSEGHSEYFGDDGIHPGMTGAAAYATMLRQAVCGQ